MRQKSGSEKQPAEEAIKDIRWRRVDTVRPRKTRVVLEGLRAREHCPTSKPSSFVVDIRLAGERRSKGLKTMAKVRVPALLSMVALTFCAAPLISLAPVGRAGATDDPSPVNERDRRRGRRAPRPRGLSLDV